jgi:hypothetical protein
MADKKDIHTVPHEDGWAVAREGAKRPSKVLDTQQEAWDETKRMAKQDGVEGFLHGRNGQIRERNTYPKSRDKHPPKG